MHTWCLRFQSMLYASTIFFDLIWSRPNIVYVNLIIKEKHEYVWKQKNYFSNTIVLIMIMDVGNET